MKKKIIIISSSLLIITFLLFNFGAIFAAVFPNKYWDYDIADDDIVVYNPINDTYRDFILYKDLLLKSEEKKNADSITYFSNKIIDFRNSFNEKQQEKLYSCGNGYWQDKSEKLLLFSKAYQNLNNIDSAISVLKPALTKNEYYEAEIREAFFSLVVKKYSKSLVKKEITENINSNYELNCDYCHERAFIFKGIEIGLSVGDSFNVEKAKQGLFNDLN